MVGDDTLPLLASMGSLSFHLHASKQVSIFSDAYQGSTTVIYTSRTTCIRQGRRVSPGHGVTV